jgi:hypothetical protein
LKPHEIFFQSGRAGRAGEAVQSLRTKGTKAADSEPLSRPAPMVEIFRGYLSGSRLRHEAKRKQFGLTAEGF